MATGELVSWLTGKLEGRDGNCMRCRHGDDHPAVYELRELAMWTEGQIWCSPERHGPITDVMKAQIDHLPLNMGGRRPTQGRTLAVMQVSGGSQSFNAVNKLRLLGRWTRILMSHRKTAIVAKAGMMARSTASTIHQGASGMWVRSSMISFAVVYASQRRRDSRSIGLSFHCLSGSCILILKRKCSAALTGHPHVRQRTWIRSNDPVNQVRKLLEMGGQADTRFRSLHFHR